MGWLSFYDFKGPMGQYFLSLARHVHMVYRFEQWGDDSAAIEPIPP